MKRYHRGLLQARYNGDIEVSGLSQREAPGPKIEDAVHRGCRTPTAWFGLRHSKVAKMVGGSGTVERVKTETASVAEAV
jgi:hypothetical protein